ncbi:hypothetical protein ES332_D07G144800v1 [Gossypium tomentosum]|uniref:TTF-type domain-containing protein n=1 Tax=Gossypium tomentosum TaxID=34277 RepID=A0A5D2K6X1_GOSTO|nr:hypothetical protein ES332_D07G144800v1 [Gossypium tomentosum]
MKLKTIYSSFKKKSIETTQSPSEASQIEVPPSSFAPLNSNVHPSKIHRVEDETLDFSNLEREPGLCKQIYELDHIKHPRYFQQSWFKQFSWLEHSPSKDAKFCLPDFLSNSNLSSRFGSTAFTHSGFSNWKKVHDRCNSNRLRLKTSIDVVQWLTFQGSTFKGHDETSYDEKVKDVLKSAPQNASYISSTIQKEILQIYASRVRNVICEEIGDRKFNIIVDEARDESRKNILNVCRYAYYVHYFSHCLQLRLVAAGREVAEVHKFFKDLSNIFSIASAFSKCSHLNSVTSLLTMYNAISMVLENLKCNSPGCYIKNSAPNYSQRGDADNAYNRLRSFEFIFILHMMKEVLRVSDNLCQALQHGSQDILNSMSLLNFPNINSQYIMGRSRKKKEDVIVEHHYQVNIFFATINTQLQELKSRFNEHVVELLTLTTTLDPKEFFKLFDIDKICILKEHLQYKLKHYELDVCKHLDLKKISTLSELCISLVENGKSVMYPLVDRLIRIILTFPISTASSECAFFVMKIVQTRLRSKMEDDFLKSSLFVHIEKEIAENFNVNKIIDDFSETKDRRVQFK